MADKQTQWLVMTGRDNVDWSMHTIEAESAEAALAEHDRRKDDGEHDVTIILRGPIDMRDTGNAAKALGIMLEGSPRGR